MTRRRNPTFAMAVHGVPVPQARARTVRHNGQSHSYTPDRTAQAMEAIAWQAKDYCPIEPFSCPLRLSVHFYLPIPQSWSKKRREDAIAGRLWPTGKPDLSNYVKLVEDALEGMVYKNDSQIVKMGESGKHYSTMPMTVIEVFELELEESRHE